MAWDPESRVASLGFDEETRAVGDDAEALVAALSGWIGNDPAPFALLGDGSKLRSVDARYRAVWGQFLRKHRERAFIAFFGMGPIIRVAAEMFRLGTGLRLRAFADESDARSWLRTRGIAA